MWVDWRRRNFLIVSLLLVSHLCSAHSTLQRNRRPLWLLKERQRRRNQQLAFLGKARGGRRHTTTTTQQIANNIKHLELQLKEIQEQEEQEIDGKETADDAEQIKKGENVEEDKIPKLNVTDEDSPYALISDFFPNQERNHNRQEKEFVKSFLNEELSEEQLESIGTLPAQDVWLSEGNLLVLKGGLTRDRNGYDDPWEPLDDYQAPYKEPKLPPPDFIPVEYGVGVPLPNEDEYGPDVQGLDEINEVVVDNDQLYVTVKSLSRMRIHPAQPFEENLVTKEPTVLNEQQLINAMENFHSIRKGRIRLDQGIAPISESSTTKPSVDYFINQTTPNSYLYSYVVSTTHAPRTTPNPRKSLRTSVGPLSNFTVSVGSEGPMKVDRITTHLPPLEDSYYQPHLPESVISRGKFSIRNREQLSPGSRATSPKRVIEQNENPVRGRISKERFHQVKSTPRNQQPVEDYRSSRNRLFPTLKPQNGDKKETWTSKSLDPQSALITPREFLFSKTESPSQEGPRGAVFQTDEMEHKSRASASQLRARANLVERLKSEFVETITRNESPEIVTSGLDTYYSAPLQNRSGEPKPSEIRSLPPYQHPIKRNVPYSQSNPNYSYPSVRRSDERYVSFYRGNVDGRSWGYSYRL
ncbi:uncharacterized protein LOC131877503 [Tigriopus californicus]|uniref:uncharacterized protein LOC131877503 n=1 Tax=Tigriopus californicus TaxID=6832 RepID=UPI0027D9E102|nr:uncharacterized protein LOC131877503 [Tigriopus californicus]